MRRITITWTNYDSSSMEIGEQTSMTDELNYTDFHSKWI